jgi:TPR repeat protein
MDSYNGHSKDGYREAVRWLRKAASVDYDCESTLGDAYIELQDYDEAMYWYRRSLKRGRRLSWIAESKIADMYAKGHGVSKNHAEAARWWEKAAQHGSDWSRYQLGELYSEGADGFEKDNRKAYFHLYIASSADGQYSPRTSAIELREKVEKELGDYWVTQEKKRADEWLTAMKEITCQESKNRVKPLPLPD